jgi:hypothetical protein
VTRSTRRTAAFPGVPLAGTARLGLALLGLASLLVAAAAGPAAAATPPGAAGASLVGGGPRPLAVAARQALAGTLRPAVPVGFGLPSPGVDPEAPGDDWTWVDAAPPAFDGDDDGTKSTYRAVALSALLPGLGERYVGNEARGTMLHVVEAAIWGTFAFYRLQAEDRQSRQIEYAGVHAGAPTGQSSDYYEHIGLWLSLDEWYDIVRRDARFRFPDDADAQAAFFEKNKRYDPSQAWAWDDDAERTRYRQIRSRAERSFRNARLAAGAAVFHRLASMIDAVALARRHNHRVESERARVDVRVTPFALRNDLAVGPVLTARY